MKILQKYSLLLMTLISFSSYADEVNEVNEEDIETIKKLLSMDLAQLLQVQVKTASGIEQTLRDAPAAMIVITDDDIRQRDYHDLTELLMDLPGFDTIQSARYAISYQRGYRTPYMQRTLIMVDGVVDNHLWGHFATISRQYPLSALERVEVLYGPTSAVYGPNAFLGIINLITKDNDDKSLKNKEIRADIWGQVGSYNSRSLEATVQGQHDELNYNLSAKIFRSDEAGLDDLAPWGFLTSEQLNNRDTWGPVLDLEHEGVRYGEYFDPTNDWGILGKINFRDFTLGLIAWNTNESEGPYYAADRVQPNAYWKRDATQLYLNHDYHANDKFTVTTQLLYHSSRIWGNWVEAIPDWEEGKEKYSYLSISDWNSLNHSWLFKQDYDYQLSDDWRFTGGLKYEAKELTKAYDICSYWSAAFCSSGNSDMGRYGRGAGVFYSTDDTVVITPNTLDTMPEENLAHTRDIGMYVQALWNQDDWRWLGGIRYDHNSIYGTTVNPRLSAIYHWSPKTTLKFLYGKAFQEPSPMQLWGGWSGRQENPELRPEKAENLEFIFMYQQNYWLHDVSLYTARYHDVIKEDAENAGNRNIWGVEYRGRFSYPNPFLSDAPDLTGYLYYTYTHAFSSITYSQTEATWLDESSEIGDIAPHKINLGINIPFDNHWHINLRANYVSTRTLYSRNPLREEGRHANSYTIFNLTTGYQRKPFEINFTIKNLFNKEYYYPGAEQADSGDDFTQRSLGFRNSLIPAEKRSFWLSVRWLIE